MTRHRGADKPASAADDRSRIRTAGGPPLTSRTAGRKNEGRTAPTTTGDATSGGMGTPSGATTSDATASGEPVGHLDELEDDER